MSTTSFAEVISAINTSRSLSTSSEYNCLSTKRWQGGRLHSLKTDSINPLDDYEVLHLNIYIVWEWRITIPYPRLPKDANYTEAIQKYFPPEFSARRVAQLAYWSNLSRPRPEPIDPPPGPIVNVLHVHVLNHPRYHGEVPFRRMSEIPAEVRWWLRCVRVSSQANSPRKWSETYSMLEVLIRLLIHRRHLFICETRPSKSCGIQVCYLVAQLIHTEEILMQDQYISTDLNTSA